jgi:hypothetical protein
MKFIAILGFAALAFAKADDDFDRGFGTNRQKAVKAVHELKFKYKTLDSKFDKFVNHNGEFKYVSEAFNETVYTVDRLDPNFYGIGGSSCDEKLISKAIHKSTDVVVQTIRSIEEWKNFADEYQVRYKIKQFLQTVQSAHNKFEEKVLEVLRCNGKYFHGIYDEFGKINDKFAQALDAYGGHFEHPPERRCQKFIIKVKPII